MSAKKEELKDAGTIEAEATRSGPHHVPAVDIFETPESIVLMVDMPGVSGEDLDIGLERGVLSVFGRARQRRLDAGFSPVLCEFERGHFQRRFQMGDDIASDGIKATMKDGVLRLVLPKGDETRVRKIEVTKG